MARAVKAACIVVAVASSGAWTLGCSRTPRDRIAAEDAANAAVVVTLPESGDLVTFDGKPVPAPALVAAFRTARAGTVRIEAPASIEWRRAVSVLDQMKQAGGGGRPFVLGVAGNPDRRSSDLAFPRAMSSMPPLSSPDAPAGEAREVVTVVAVAKDGAVMLNGAPSPGDLASALGKLSPPLRERQVVIQGDPQAPFGAIVDATRSAQREGGRVTFSVTAIAPTPPPPAPR